MKISKTEENYLKVIFSILEKGKPVKILDIGEDIEKDNLKYKEDFLEHKDKNLFLKKFFPSISLNIEVSKAEKSLLVTNISPKYLTNK